MNVHLNTLLPVGLIIASLAILTACHTVEGTVHGAGQDIQTVTNAVNPPEKTHNYRHHTKSMSNKNNTSEKNMSTQNTSKQMEQKKSNSSSSSDQTNTSY